VLRAPDVKAVKKQRPTTTVDATFLTAASQQTGNYNYYKHHTVAEL